MSLVLPGSIIYFRQKIDSAESDEDGPNYDDIVQEGDEMALIGGPLPPPLSTQQQRQVPPPPRPADAPPREPLHKYEVEEQMDEMGEQSIAEMLTRPVSQI